MYRAFAAVLIITGSIAAAQPAPTELDLSPTRVAMFKNGYGIVTAVAPLPAESGPFRLAPLPSAALGSFWLSWPEGVAVDGIVSRYAQRSEATPASSITEMLQANVGQPIEVLVAEEWLAGTLQSLPLPPTPETPEVRTNRSISYPPPTPGPVLLVLAQGDAVRVIPINTITQLRIPGNPSLDFNHTRREPVLDLTLTGSADKPEEARLQLEYTAAGITWSPSYRVDISDPDHARISAKAIIINDLLDLRDTHVELITGYPHLQYAGLDFGLSLDPLTQFLAGFRESNGRDAPQFALTQALSNTARGYGGGGGGGGGGTFGDSPNMPTDPVLGEAAEDLYFYQVPAVTLAKGDRGYFPLFAAQVPYSHCYTWEIPDFIDEDNRYRNNNDEQPREEIVWHAVRLKNTTDRPWTTAPGQTTQGGRLLGQDTLHYTTPGTSTDLKITQALAVRVEQNEQEAQRERNATKFYGYNYDKVTIRGELKVTNYKTEPVTVSIQKSVSGEVTQTDGNPDVTKLATGLRRVNPRSQLLWQLEVKPGQDHSQTLTYTYEVYVRN